MNELTTCWNLLVGASQGQSVEVDQFCERYRPLVLEFLSRRWTGRLASQDIEDAVQETLMECIRDQGAIDKAVQGLEGRFRGFLFGVTKNVALRFEERAQKRGRLIFEKLPPSEFAPAMDQNPQRDFDRAWAANILRLAREQLDRQAHALGERAIRRSQLLHLRFVENRPIRDIARLWGAPVEHLHREYAQARIEFKEVLIETLRLEHPSGAFDVESELRELLELTGAS